MPQITSYYKSLTLLDKLHNFRHINSFTVSIPVYYIFFSISADFVEGDYDYFHPLSV